VDTDKSAHYENSTLRERIVEHVFVGAALRTLWRLGAVDVEVLRSDFDRAWIRHRYIAETHRSSYPVQTRGYSSGSEAHMGNSLPPSAAFPNPLRATHNTIKTGSERLGRVICWCPANSCRSWTLFCRKPIKLFWYFKPCDEPLLFLRYVYLLSSRAGRIERDRSEAIRVSLQLR
jgi:hypothetical protein